MYRLEYTGSCYFNNASSSLHMPDDHSYTPYFGNVVLIWLNTYPQCYGKTYINHPCIIEFKLYYIELV